MKILLSLILSLSFTYVAMLYYLCNFISGITTLKMEFQPTIFQLYSKTKRIHLDWYGLWIKPI